MKPILRRVPYDGRCAFCRKNIARGSDYRMWGGFWRHPACEPPTETKEKP